MLSRICEEKYYYRESYNANLKSDIDLFQKYIQMGRGSLDRKRHINQTYSSIPRDTCSLTRYLEMRIAQGYYLVVLL